VSNSLIAIRLGLLAIDRLYSLGVLLCTIPVNITGVPDELLDELVGVLVADHELRSLDDVATILDQLATVRAQGLLVDGRVLEHVGKRLVDLGIGGHTAFAEGVDHAVEA